MAIKEKDINYFDALQELTTYSVKAAAMLVDICNDYKADEIGVRVEAMHDVEHEADIKNHLMMSKLVREFITPIDREDIINLAHLIDNVTDAIEDIALGFYMFNVTELRGVTKAYAKVIMQGAEKVQELMGEFKNFRKSKNIHQLIVESNNLEEDGDALYKTAMRELYETEPDPVQIIVWTKLFNRMERACDAFENVSDIVETVCMKNY